MADEDFEFGEKLLPLRDREIAPERWTRVREEIVFRDLVRELLTKSGTFKTNGSAVSCPFHGKDSTPSFTFYDSSNSAYCFGCPPPKRNQTYDPVSFVSKYFEISPTKALQWIEKRYELPFIMGQLPEDEEDEEEESEGLYTVDDLKPMYLTVAPSLIDTVDDAKQIVQAYFLAVTEENPLFLARILGRERIASISSYRM